MIMHNYLVIKIYLLFIIYIYLLVKLMKFNVFITSTITILYLFFI